MAGYTVCQNLQVVKNILDIASHHDTCTSSNKGVSSFSQPTGEKEQGTEAAQVLETAERDRKRDPDEARNQ